MSFSSPDSSHTYVDAQWAFQRYEAVRARLPAPGRAGEAQPRADLGELSDRFDAFVFDSFGVLNVGGMPIEGAARRIADLRARGKRLFVLTNAARDRLAGLPDKYAGLGFDFSAREIVSSREVLGAHLQIEDEAGPWWVVAPQSSCIAELGVSVRHAEQNSAPSPDSKGVILLSAVTMTDALMQTLRDVLSDRPMRLLVGNPDLVAPRETGFSLEPGAYAHQLADEVGAKPEFFGKPFANAFQAVLSRLAGTVPPDRIAMVGDTLHTDILGGSAAGMGTVLVTRHGVLKDLDLAACMAQSKIFPDYVVPQI